MNLYGRPLTDPIDPDNDRLPILDASAAGDDNVMRDVTVKQLRSGINAIITCALDAPTVDELPVGQFAVCLLPNGEYWLFAQTVDGPNSFGPLT